MAGAADVRGDPCTPGFHVAMARVIRLAEQFELSDCNHNGRGTFLSPDERICPRCESAAIRLTRRGFFEVVFEVQGDAVEVVAVREPVETTSSDETICRACGYDIGRGFLEHVHRLSRSTAAGAGGTARGALS